MSIVKNLMPSRLKQKAATRLLLFCLLLTFSFPAITGFATDSAPLKAITVVSDDNYPPYIFRDAKSRLQGIIVDEWRLWEKKTGIRVDLRGMDWEKAQKTMAAGHAQVIDTIFFTEERAKTLAFSAPYASLDVPIFFHRDISGIKDVTSLHGFTIGVKAGDACIDFFKRHGISTLREYPSYESIVRAAAEQEIKVFCMDAPPAQYYLYKMNLEQQYRQTAPLYTGQFHRAVKKEREDLLATIEEGFAKISRNEHEEIEKRWRGSSISLPHYLPYIFYLMGGLVILGAVLMLWNYTLHRKVTERTVQLREAIDGLKKSEDKYRNLFENASEAIFVAQNGRLVFVNPMSAAMTGYSAEELTAKPFVEFIHADDRGMVIDRHLRRIKGEVIPDRYSFRIIHRNGPRWVELNAVSIDWNGSPATLNFMVDITDRKWAEEALRESEEKLMMALHGGGMGMWDVDLTTLSGTIDERAAQILGYRKDQISTQIDVWDEMTHPEDLPRLKESIQAHLEGRMPVFKADHRMRMATGEWKWVQGRGKISKRHIDGSPSRISGTIHDITDQKRMEEALRESENRYRELSTIDDLTQLYNSRHFYHQLRMELDRVDRYGQPLTLLLLDLDDFKVFNDTYGHVEGDQVLSRLGQVVRRCLRQTDSAYRYGGEEFTILLPMTTSADSVVTAERIRTEFQEERFYPSPGREVHMTVSIGLSQYKPQEDMKVFVHRVDQLMYQGKKKGKNRVCSK